MMKKKETYTNITPLPSFIPRQLALDILHSHSEIITLNPLVLSHKAIPAPRDAAADEFYSTWYEITERIQYVPGMGKMGAGKISFRGCFHDVPWGLQTHVYAPMGVDIRNNWRVAGNQPGETRQEVRELGVAGIPPDGLYLREDIEIRCNIALVSFVKAQLKASTKVLVDRLIKKAELLDAGVLQAMMDQGGKLRTVNPADRSGQTLQNQQKLQEQIQQQRASLVPSPQPPLSPISTGVPLPYYQLPLSPTFRPGTMESSLSNSSGAPNQYPQQQQQQQQQYNPYQQPPQQYQQHPPPQYQPYPQQHLAQHPSPLQGQSPTHSPQPNQGIMELPGDTFHYHSVPPPLQFQQQQQAEARHSSQYLSTPSSGPPSDYTNAQQNATAPSSRPTSYTSINTGGDGNTGYRSPGPDQKSFTAELPAMHEESHSSRPNSTTAVGGDNPLGITSVSTDKKHSRYGPEDFGYPVGGGR